MTNEMDLHASDRQPNFGFSRMLVYYYLVLILLAPIIFLVVHNSAWEFVFSAVFLIAFISPLAYALRKRRSLHRLRQAQVNEPKKPTD